MRTRLDEIRERFDNPPGARALSPRERIDDALLDAFWHGVYQDRLYIDGGRARPGGVQPAPAEEKCPTCDRACCRLHTCHRKGERRKGTEQRSYLDTSLNDEPRELWRPDKTWAWRFTCRSGKDRRKS